ncbi:hypothetical protein BBJ28_00011364, partial [Nothophytophthora sp. Chile5]
MRRGGRLCFPSAHVPNQPTPTLLLVSQFKMQAIEHSSVNTQKLSAGECAGRVLVNPTPVSPDDASSRDEFQTLGVDELTALLGCLEDQHSSTPLGSSESGSDELFPVSPPLAPMASRASVTGKRARSFGDDDDMKGSNTRMRTYTARKIEALMEELPALEAYVDYLKHQAAKINNQTNSTQKQQLVNSCLRDTAHKQQFALARVHSALSDFTVRRQQLRTRQEKLIPFDNFIHLGKDKKQRLSTLLAAKPRVLRDARRFMRERTEFTDLSVPSSEQTCFVSPSGDYCALKFVVMPLEGAVSAKQVFDTLKFYLFHMEIMISEATGDLTLCE